jgi:hypothetical protein
MIVIVTAAAALIIGALAVRKLFRTAGVTLITGAVIARNQNPHMERPIAGASVIVSYGAVSWKGVSEPSGLFRLRLDAPVPEDDTFELRVEHPSYHPTAITATAHDRIYVLRLTPKEAAQAAPSGRTVTIGNIRIRYATRTTSTSTVGTAVRTFDVVNKGNVPCEGRPPCSPDGKWKASTDSLSLDTGDESKQFRNVRVSCIAGPCPFSAINLDGFSRGGRSISVSIRNWSDTVTYLLEAEVATTMETELIRHTYPVTFGRTMNFTLPAVASGLTIEAEVDDSPIVFPIGPELRLSWATCRLNTAAEGAKQFRCELKPGYEFD